MKPFETASVLHADFDRVLELNNRHAVELSWLDRAGLEHLVSHACYARRTTDSSAFLITINSDAAHGELNFGWFREQFSDFIYADRVVVAPGARGRGLARGLYTDLFAHAALWRRKIICCEVNADPPNPISDAFHQSLGFRIVGEALIPSGKTVRYLTRDLACVDGAMLPNILIGEQRTTQETRP